MSKQIINVSVLPGEPTDGTGRICIHLWVNDPGGSFTEPHVMQTELNEDGTPKIGHLYFGPAKGRLACNPKKNPAPVEVKGVKLNTKRIANITHRSDDPRAITCPKCMATEEYARIMQQQEV